MVRVGQVYRAIPLSVTIAIVLVFPGQSWVAPGHPSSPERNQVDLGLSQNTGNATPGGDFTSYLGGPLRDSSSFSERLINVSSVSALHSLWQYGTSGAIAAQAVVSQGVVFVGSWDGYEYALDSDRGTLLWQTYLGQDFGDPGCRAGAGVTSTATVVGPTLYVVGGDANFYALSAATGAILWRTSTGNTSLGYYGWSSPLIYKGNAFLGIASRCDNPLVTGGLMEISLRTHSATAFFNATALGTVGASIWSSPSLDRLTNTIFVTTGNPGPNGSVYGNSIVSLNATTLAVQGSWAVPANQAITDGDFGSTPTLVNPRNGAPLVVATNKNGITYALYRSNLSLAWQQRISSGKVVTSAAWGDQRIFLAGATTKIGGTKYNASIRALSPQDGHLIWQTGLPNIITFGYSSPLYFQGVVILGDGSTIFVLSAATGRIIESISLGSIVEPPASISRGIVYVGTADGEVHALDLQLSVGIGEAGTSSTSPVNESFFAQITGGVLPYAYNWSFGDGNFSDVMNPVHLYVSPGNFTVSLIVYDQTGVAVIATLEEDLD